MNALLPRSCRIVPLTQTTVSGRLCWITIAASACVLVWGGWHTAPAAAQEVLRETKVVALADDAEYQIQIRARAPGTSWEQEGSPCALLKLLVDDRYDQHLFLAGGAEVMDYNTLLGPLTRGEHVLRIEWDTSWTPALRVRPELSKLQVLPLDRSDPRIEPILRAPILHLRKDTVGRFSDVPLILYWDMEQAPSQVPQVTYTIVFSNEDGGTDTERLMARWGRTTDIEWCYAYYRSGSELHENFQGSDHKTLPFQGQKEGWHPILYNATLNNNFADSIPNAPEVRVRLLPVSANLQGGSRETVMDRFPWTYTIMAHEMLRENKLEHPPLAHTKKVSDLRNYAYLEVCSLQRGTELYFELQLKRSGHWFSSDHRDSRAGIGRGGCVRSSVELPQGTRPEDLRALRIQCRPAPVPQGERPVRSPRANLAAVNKLFFLEEGYRPGANLLQIKLARTLKPGESLTLPVR